MDNKLDTTMVLKQIAVLERELVRLKRDILHSLLVKKSLKR